MQKSDIFNKQKADGIYLWMILDSLIKEDFLNLAEILMKAKKAYLKIFRAQILTKCIKLHWRREL